MTIIPLALTNCITAQWSNCYYKSLHLYMFLMENNIVLQHSFLFLSIRNKVIPPQLVQMTIKAMLEPNLNLSMHLLQHEDTMIPMY